MNGEFEAHVSGVDCCVDQPVGYRLSPQDREILRGYLRSWAVALDAQEAEESAEIERWADFR